MFVRLRSETSAPKQAPSFYVHEVELADDVESAETPSRSISRSSTGLADGAMTNGLDGSAEPDMVDRSAKGKPFTHYVALARRILGLEAPADLPADLHAALTEGATGATVAKLIEEGRIRISDTAPGALPCPDPAGQPIQR